MKLTMRELIVEGFGAKTLRKSALNIRGGAGVFERVLSGKGYTTALEIGTYKGCSAEEISQYVRQVVTIDLKHGKLEHNKELWNRRAFWDSLDVFNIDLQLVADDAEKATLINALAFDFAFIDGGHDSGSVETDFKLVRRCGRVLFHDADDNGPGRANAVHNFVKTLPQEQVEFMDIFAYWQAPVAPWPFPVSPR